MGGGRGWGVRSVEGGGGAQLHRSVEGGKVGNHSHYITERHIAAQCHFHSDFIAVDFDSR